MSDDAQRARALDPGSSFLVQAPAGSGKTALLTQRFLRLLATVDEPEQILAITFTRKAASEMRLRVLGQLRSALSPAPEDAFARQGWELASQALARDSKRGWKLLDAPRRLRIMTIDSFEASLVNRLPWLARWGVSAGVAEHPQPIYAEVVRESLRMLAEFPGAEGENFRALITLLNLRDNRIEDLSTMLVNLVERRDEWLLAFGAEVLMGDNTDSLRERLEGNLRQIVEARLASVCAVLPVGLDAELAPLARRAAANLVGTNHPIEHLASFRSWPDGHAEELPVWRGIRELLVTKTGSFRSGRGLDKRCGFPPEDKASKAQMAALVDRIRDNAGLEVALSAIGALPDPHYSDDQWQTLAALFRLLRVMLPVLHVQFAKRRETDFTEIALRADSALGDAPELPSVLAERLDAQIRHILVDEFQDTSVLQMRIVRKLTENWGHDDGRTLFLVGDPMQSIYGWRNARVDLFLRVWSRELHIVHRLETIQLTRNFRSHPQLVMECNEVFQRLFPTENDAATGSVRHASAVAGRSGEDAATPRIRYQAFFDGDDPGEAAWIAEEVLRLRGAAMAEGLPEPKVGVLFRAGAKAIRVAEALAARGLRYQAIDLESLSELPVVSDLRILVDALLSTSNRLAWWSILRAPWNGLRLQQLEQLHKLSEGSTVWRAIQRACRDARDSFDADTLRRLERTQEIFQEAFAWRGRRPLSELVQALFLSSGAAHCHSNARAQLAAAQFFRVLLGTDEAELMGNPSLLGQVLAQMKAPPDPEAPESLQLLTIHKAKGLEFDFVFVPFLNSGLPSAGASALSWEEVPPSGAEVGERDELLVIVPGAPSQSPSPSLLDMLKARRAAREEQERLRVLYVAFTRAREALYLSATIDAATQKQAKSPAEGEPTVVLQGKRGSALKLLWPSFESQFYSKWQDRQLLAPLSVADENPTSQTSAYPLLRRLSLPSLPALPAAAAGSSAVAAGTEGRYYRPGGSWETLESAAGTVFHRIMELAADGETLARMAHAAEELQPVVLDELRQLLPSEPGLQAAASTVVAGLQRTALSATGKWIFATSHRQILTEQTIAHTEGNQPREARLDRVFQDENGLWHIVDFKLVDEQPADLDAFKKAQSARYRETMEHYGRLWQQQIAGPVALTLYFPLQDAHVQWTIPSAVLTAG